MPARTGTAHVVTTTRKYKDQVYRTHLLRRSYREGGVVKNLWLRRWPAECSCGLALAPERASPSISDLVLWLVAASGLVLVMWLD